MKKLFFLTFFVVFNSCFVSSQKNIETKIVKDTLYFNFDENILQFGKVIEDEYTFTDLKNSSEGVSFRVEKIIDNLKPTEILNFENYINTIKKLKTNGRTNSDNEKIFKAFEYNTVIFINDLDKTTKYLVIKPSIYSIE